MFYRLVKLDREFLVEGCEKGGKKFWCFCCPQKCKLCEEVLDKDFIKLINFELRRFR